MLRRFALWYADKWRRAWNDTDHLEQQGDYGYAFLWLMVHAMLLVLLSAALYTAEKWLTYRLTGGSLP